MGLAQPEHPEQLLLLCFELRKIFTMWNNVYPTALNIKMKVIMS